MKLLKKNIMLLLLTTSLLVGCGRSGDSSATSQDETSSDYTQIPLEMDPNEFEYPTNEVSETKLVTYEAPKLLNPSKKVTLKVEDEDVFVYETRVNHRRSFTFAYPETTAPVAIFDFEGQVNVEVTVLEGQVESAVVRPLAYAIHPEINGNKITFPLSFSGNYTLEWNEDPETAFHIFANPLEKDPIDSNNVPSNVTYIGPGIYDADAIPLGSNETIYIAGGAVVYGQIRAEGIQNSKIRGRGIISGRIFDRVSENQFTLPIELRNSSNILIEDITILDPAGWSVTLYKCDGVEINNLKTITARGNGDGISVQSSSNVHVNGGFVRTWDDSLVVKNVDRGNTNNIVFDNVVVWTDLAQSMEVGFETNGPTMSNITFRNITVIHNFHKPVMSIHNSDDADVTNVVFENITLEDGQMFGDNRDDGLDDYFIDLTIAYSIEWSKSGANRGSIDGVTFKNIKSVGLADSIISRINGEGSDSAVKNVSFENIYIGNRPINNADDLKLVTNEHVSGVSFLGSSEPRGAVIKLPYKLNLASDVVSKEKVTAPEQEGLIVPEFARSQGDLPFSGVPNKGNFTAVSSYGTGTSPLDPVSDGSGVFEQEGYSGGNVIDGDLITSWRTPAWRGQENEFAALEIEFDTPQYIGQIRLYGEQDNVYAHEYTLQVFGRRLTSSGEPMARYVRIKSMSEYSMSPRSGNAIDINIRAEEYAGIQIRIFNTDSILAPKNILISEVEFYAPSLTFNKAIVSSTPHADVYPVEKINDGDAGGTSYYESAELPAHVVIDMGQVYDISVIVLRLNPSLLWDRRVQNIEIQINGENVDFSEAMTFTTLFAAADYAFDPLTGNRVILELAEPSQARFIKLIINSNDIAGGYGAQISEISVYGQ